jgi:murein DD-endopeptidase MepM/ murein hydrolase activator NlpD
MTQDMDWQHHTRQELGDHPPITGGGKRRPPDRRDVSARWLSGTFLTGVTSTLLMGVALYAALDGRNQLAIPPEVLVSALNASADGSAKQARIAFATTVELPSDRRRMEISTISQVGDRNVVRMTPFMQIDMALAAGHNTTQKYPRFDPFKVFADDGEVASAEAESPGIIYGEKVESEVSLTSVPFPFDAKAFDTASNLTTDEVENVVRITGGALTDGDFRAAALHYVDPQRFGTSAVQDALNGRFGVRIVPENVSVSPRDVAESAETFAERVIAVTKASAIKDIFKNAGVDAPNASGMADALAQLLSSDRLKEGTLLRIGTETEAGAGEIVRVSAYSGADHLVTIALDDRKQYVAARPPELNPSVQLALPDAPQPVRVRGDLPSVYDGIYRAAYSYGLTDTMAARIVKLVAADVDFQARLSPSDRIEVLFTDPSSDDTATKDSDILVMRATFSGTTHDFYRFQSSDGTIDYYDAKGRSSRQFLLRSPVPTGTFRSGFGGRRHPILGYVKMHTGVDWAAPRGTPIIAAGNGTVEKSGWAGGYGKQTIIRHANGYETSYNHQSNIAKGIKVGARVRQGQVIGYVGTTGLSTGPHLHYELIVNGNKVDPMRVRLPTGKVLKGDELARFERERERIDQLMEDEPRKPDTVALADPA